MITDLRPYPRYKEWGLPWLGSLPEHWAVRRMKSAVVNINDQTSEMGPGDVYVALEHVASWTGHARPQTDAALFTGHVKRFRQGDVLFGKLRPYLAKVTQIKGPGVCAGEFFVLRSTDPQLSPSYLEKQLQAKQTIDVINGSTFGAKMPRADWQFCGNLPIALPPLAEQAAIVRFLDWANGRLERAIHAKQNVIALLGEQKQTIIHRAVTRGLDPSVPLQPSGIPWLGAIPQNWEVRRAKYLFREVDERSNDGSEELLSVSHLTGVTPRSQKNITMFKAASYAGHKLCRPGDLVVNTMWAWMGALGVSTHAGIVSPAYAVYRPHRPQDVVGVYIDGLLRSVPYVSNIICRSTGLRGSRLRLYPEEFLRLPIILPPADEQRRIVEWIQRETAATDTALNVLDRDVELLREYRTRLVADVVTGKVDVREVAGRLPDKSPADTAEDDTDLSDEAEATDEDVAA